MNEYLQDVFNYYKEQGYKGDIEAFQSSLSSDDKLLADIYEDFKSQGFQGDITQFAEITGLKKKEDPTLESIGEEDSTAGQEPNQLITPTSEVEQPQEFGQMPEGAEIPKTREEKFILEVEEKSGEIAESIGQELDEDFFSRPEVQEQVGIARDKALRQAEFYMETMKSSGISPSSEQAQKQISDYLSLVFETELSSNDKFNELQSMYEKERNEKVSEQVSEYQKGMSLAYKANDLKGNFLFQVLEKNPATSAMASYIAGSDNFLGEMSTGLLYRNPASRIATSVAELSETLEANKKRLIRMDAEGKDVITEYSSGSAGTGAAQSKIEFSREEVEQNIANLEERMAKESPDLIAKALNLSKISEYLAPDENLLEGDYSFGALGSLMGEQIANMATVPIVGTYQLEAGATYLDAVREIAREKHGDDSDENILKVIENGEDGAADILASGRVAAMIDVLGYIPMGKGISIAAKGAKQMAKKKVVDSAKKTIFDRIKNKATREFIEGATQTAKGALLSGGSEFPTEFVQSFLMSKSKAGAVEEATGVEQEINLQEPLKEGLAGLIVGTALPIGTGTIRSTIGGAIKGADFVADAAFRKKGLNPRPAKSETVVNGSYSINGETRSKRGVEQIIDNAKSQEELNGIEIQDDAGLEAKLKAKFDELQPEGVRRQVTAGNTKFSEPVKEVKSIADDYYVKKFGSERPKFEGVGSVDKEYAKRISDAFEALEDNPDDPQVKEAYEAMAQETMEQYQDFADAGYVIEINDSEPYTSSKAMLDDIRDNKRMKILSTESEYGDAPITEEQRQKDPLLRDSGIKDVNGKPLLINDIFRAIHDFYGHAELGNSFGAIGEENAWNVHARMFSPLARRAMTTETRGQNSYVNFSGVNSEAFKLRDKARQLRREGKTEEAQKLTEQVYEMMSFAEQKRALLPEEFSSIPEENTVISPENSSNYANLTEDSQGNFVFFHVGNRGYSEIKVGTGQSGVTSPAEASAISKVGGLAMYYTDDSRERQVGGKQSEYAVKVPKEKVYDFNSDQLNLIKEARELFKKENPNLAFNPNFQLAYVTKIAEEKGFDMVVAEWGGKTRAQTTKTLKPSDVKELDGNKVVKAFSEKFTQNNEKYQSLIPKTKEEKLSDVYDKIHKERNKDGRYDTLYRLYTDSGKFSQSEITKMINDSDLSSELKGEYTEAVNSKEEKRASVLRRQKKSEASNRGKYKVKDQARKAEVALSEVTEGVSLVVSESKADYDAAIDENKNLSEEERQAMKESNGFYDPATKTAYINPETATETTAAHEATHALFKEALGTWEQADKVTSEMWQTVKDNTTDEQLMSELDEFAQKYEQDGKLVMSSEAISELFGILSSRQQSLNQKQRSGIKKFIDEVLTFLGFNRMSVDQTFELINDVASRLAKGDIITEQTIAPVKRKTIGEKISKAKDSVTQGARRQADKQRFDKEVEGVVSKSEARGIKNPKTIYDNVIAYAQGSKWYEEATDIQREEFVRGMAERFGQKFKKAPSVNRVLGKKEKKVTVNERTALKDQIKLAGRAARDAKSAIRQKRKVMSDAIKEMAQKGRITTSQAKVLMRKLNGVDVLKDSQVDAFMEYADKIFDKAELADTILRYRNRRKAAAKNVRSKTGTTKGKFPSLSKLFSIDPKAIPSELLPEYIDLIDKYSPRKKALKGIDPAADAKIANDILKAIEQKQDQLMTLTDAFQEFGEKVLKEDGSVDVDATIDAMLKAEEIGVDQAKLLRDNKTLLTEKDAVEFNREEHEAEARVALDNVAEDYESNFTNEYERKAAKEFLAKIGKNLDKLTDSQLRNLPAVLDNLSNGIFTNYANGILRNINSQIAKNNIKPTLKNAKFYWLDKLLSKITSGFGKWGSWEAKYLGRNPTAFIDDILGANSNILSKNTFNKVKEAFSLRQEEERRISHKLEDAISAISKAFKKNPNRTVREKFLIQAYLLERHFRSNPLNKKVHSAKDIINATIEFIENAKESDRIPYGQREKELLQEILELYGEGQDIDMDAIFDDLSDAGRDAIKVLDEINESLREKAEFTSGVVRGDMLTFMNDYVHYDVMRTLKEDVNDMDNKLKAFLSPSTKAGSLNERTQGVKPMLFDPFASTEKSARGVLTEFYLSDIIKEVGSTFKQLSKEVKADNDNELSRTLVDALDDHYQNLIRTALEVDFSRTNIWEDMFTGFRSNVYRALLASMPRAVNELMSNYSYAAIYNTEDLISFFSSDNKALALNSDRLSNVLLNVKSSVIDKLVGEKLTGKNIDFGQSVSTRTISSQSLDPEFLNRIKQIGNLLPLGSKAGAIADALVSTPDKAVSRPIWLGVFSREFKAITGQDIDMNAVEEGNEQYLEDNKEAIQEAKTKADDEVTRAATSTNPMDIVMRDKVIRTGKDSDGGMVRAIKEINRFLNNFVMYEYSSARMGVRALVGNGVISREKGARIIAAVTARMTLYTYSGFLLKNVMSNMIASMFGFDIGEDRDRDESKALAKSLIGSVVALFVGRNSGSLSRTVENVIIEGFNKNNLTGLREREEYDSFTDNIAFSVLPPEDFAKIASGQKSEYEILKEIPSPYTPIFDAVIQAFKSGTEAVSGDRREKREAAMNEGLVNLGLDALAYSGRLPFYRDMMDLINKKRFKDYRNEKARVEKQSKLKKERVVQELKDAVDTYDMGKVIEYFNKLKEEGKEDEIFIATDYLRRNPLKLFLPSKTLKEIEKAKDEAKR